MAADQKSSQRKPPHPVDTHVGSRVRLRRIFLGYSQEKLAHALGLTFQQIQKYERGANRISASKLFQLARLLDVPVGFFFEGADEALEGKSPQSSGESESLAAGDHLAEHPDLMSRRETLQLVSTYYKIVDPNVRHEVLSLLKALGKSDV